MDSFGVKAKYMSSLDFVHQKQRNPFTGEVVRVEASALLSTIRLSRKGLQVQTRQLICPRRRQQRQKVLHRWRQFYEERLSWHSTSADEDQ
jgi:hypothetical protein